MDKKIKSDEKETVLAVGQCPELIAETDGFNRYLEKHEYEVISIPDGQSCISFLESDAGAADIVIIDLQFPDRDGLALITEISDLTHVPLIVLGENTETALKIVGLELGADDYLEKPFDKQELLARMKSALRRYYEVPEQIMEDLRKSQQDKNVDVLAPGEIYHFSHWVYDPQKFLLTGPDRKIIELTSGENELFSVFIRAPKRVLTREKLFELIKHEDYDSYARVIDVQISRLRKKLGDDPHSPRFIKTVHGAGYMLNVDVDVEQGE